MAGDAKQKTGLKLHVVSNTHWDREWVYPFQETRLLLLDFFDDLLDLYERDPNFPPFLLDSQVIPVEDYLELRPENEHRIKKVVREGKLIIGPWYTLPEEYIINGESLVRNLVIGHRVTRKYGPVSKIGYTPFSYGQTSQMPQIYRGFGIDTIIFYRGINTPKSEFIMESPDGSQVLGCRFGALSRFSYYFYVYRMVRYGMSRDEWWYDWRRDASLFRLATDRHPHAHYYVLQPEAKQWNVDILPKQLKKLIDDETQHFTTRHIALMMGFDTSSPDPDEPKLIQECQKIVSEWGHEIFPSTLERFMREMAAEVQDPQVIKGESRDPGATGKWTHLMGDVLSSRAHTKRKNFLTEMALQRWAEPFAALGWLVGGEYPKTALDLAWRYLLKNHPHDTVCGAGIDQMEKDMIYRYDQCRIISEGVAKRGMWALQKAIDTSDLTPRDSVVTIFNPLPVPRTEVLSMLVDLPENCGLDDVRLEDEAGNALPVQVVSRQPAGTLVRNLQDISLELRSERVHLHALVDDIPAYGYRTYVLARKDRRDAEGVSLAPDPRILENDHLRVEVADDGRLDILHKESGRWLRGFHYFEDDGEAGHPWIHISPDHDKKVSTVGSKAEIELVEAGPLLARVKVRHVLSVPTGLEEKADGVHRGSAHVDLPIESLLTIRKGQRYLEVETTVDNRAEQHRLRVCFPTGVAAEVSAAEAAFDVIERPIDRKPGTPYYGRENPTYPMHRFVDLSDGEFGVSFLNDGMREYEAVDDDVRTVCLTLFRAFTAMQSPVIDRWTVYPDMKLAQHPGVHTWRYGILPHAGDWDQGGVLLEAERFVLPLEAAQAGRTRGSLPRTFGFLELRPERLAVTAFKRAEDRDTLILRFFNPSWEDVEGELILGKVPSEVWLCNLNEERQEPVPVSGNTLKIPVGHKKIVTLELVYST